MDEAQELLLIVGLRIHPRYLFTMDTCYLKVLLKYFIYILILNINWNYLIYLGIVKSPLGGDFISNQCSQYFEENSIEVIPPYMIAGKEQVWENEKAKYTKRPNIPEVTKSWNKYMVKVTS